MYNKGIRKLHNKIKPHNRTISVPSTLPSRGLSLEVLLDAIDIDQELKQVFTSELLKTKNRSSFDYRRRIKSAPSAPPSYYQKKFNTRWITGQTVITTESEAHSAAQSIVIKHFQTVKKSI
ncbi:unnamed protein product [Rhizopus stolonifer]